ncbi:HAD hydrolase-like protein [Alphaproteobacteria bacterium]|nr:HAD hydrolase-like protein [Alphaproteobacteria bacterium]
MSVEVYSLNSDFEKHFESCDNFLFDCDGVILNSNYLKTLAFREALGLYPQSRVDEFIKYHVSMGGVSRYAKFNYFFQEIYFQPNSSDLAAEVSERFANILCDQLRNAEMAANLSTLRSLTSEKRWYVISGGDQAELRQLFKSRSLSTFFDGGVYGSPRNKYEIIDLLISNGSLSGSSVFFGDTSYDMQVAQHYGFKFIFVHGWSEQKELLSLCCQRNIPTIKALENLINPESSQ